MYNCRLGMDVNRPVTVYKLIIKAPRVAVVALENDL
jgi:hypothetical protein